jgi:uncharacterized metal-binding protein
MGGGLLAGDAGVGLAVGVGCLSGILLTPDLDQEGMSWSEYWLVKWTFGVGFLWPMIWYAYAWAIPHRSLWSHLPGFGTAVRVLYLGAWVGLVDWVFGWRVLPTLLSIRSNLLLGWFVGLCVSDLAHMLMDVAPKRKKKKRKR